MVDRDNRNRLAELIRSYLNEEIMAFDFDDALDDFRQSQDDAIRFVSNTVWYHYDDCDDHSVVLSKTEWNYFQRLLLLLESDSKVSLTQTLQWTSSQLLAAALLLICISIVISTGFGPHLLIYFIPFGIGSVAISLFRRPIEKSDSERNRGPYYEIVTPFASLADLRTAYVNTPFQKLRYPPQLAGKTIRSPLMHWSWIIYSFLIWSMVAPIPLLFQCFPFSKSEVSISPA